MHLAADMRSLLGTGQYVRRVAKVLNLKGIIYNPYDVRRDQLVSDIEKYKARGMEIDIDIGQIKVRTTTSWIISSARFGSESFQGKPLLSMGDIDRYRWRSYLPEKEERLKVVSEVGSLPPVTVNQSNIRALNEAWRTLFSSLRAMTADRSIEVPRNGASYQERKRAWDETQKEMEALYPDMNEVYIDQLVTLRSAAEFRRLMYQHAALKQFERNPGYDFSTPDKFIIDYKEDGEFAKQLWLYEYVPSMMDVVDDVLSLGRYKRRRTTKTELGRQLVLECLRGGSRRKSELQDCVRDAGIKDALLSNYILPKLLQARLICQPKRGLYNLRGECENCRWKESCDTLTLEQIW